MLTFCFFKQKTAYEMRISDWSSDVCSSDLRLTSSSATKGNSPSKRRSAPCTVATGPITRQPQSSSNSWRSIAIRNSSSTIRIVFCMTNYQPAREAFPSGMTISASKPPRSEEHTSELQSLMRNSYAVLCLKKKTNTHDKKIESHQ